MNWLSRWSGNRTADRGGVVLDNNAGLVNTGTIRGDIYIVQGENRRLLPLFPPFQELRPDASLFSLLSWQSRVTELIGRDAEMAELLRWTGGRDIHIKLVIGPGGVGKTRLAAELADRLDEQGWRAVFLDFVDFGAKEKPAGIELGRNGTLLIVDYPEANREAIGHLLQLLARQVGTLAAPLRVLLLTRADFEQWENDFNRSGARALLDEQPLLLDVLPEQDPRTLFQAAVERFARQFPEPALPVSADSFETWLDQDRTLHRRPLFILALALNSFQQAQATDYQGPAIVRALCQRELVRLQKESAAAGMGDNALAQLLALAAVAGALDDRQLIALAENAGQCGMDLPAPSKIIDALRKTHRLVGRKLPAPGPDIVAAELTIAALLDNSSEASAPLGEAIWICVAHDPVTSLARLGRLDYDTNMVLGRQNHGLVNSLGLAVDGNPDRCRHLEIGVSEANSLELGLVELATVILRTLVESAEDEEERAANLTGLSIRLSDQGKTTAALAAIEQAVAIYQRLASQEPARFEPDLASSLNNLSNRQADQGDTIGALATIEQAVTISQRLTLQNPKLEFHLATSLNNLSNRRADQGDKAGALATIEQAVEIYRRLVSQEPARFKPDLAMGLSNLANRYADQGDTIRALAASEEAVAIYRHLASQTPARFEPKLADNLINLSVRQAEQGKVAAALVAVEQAVAIYQRLVLQVPARFEPGLAGSLNNLSILLSEQGDTAGALAAIKQTVAIYQRLALQVPARFEPALASSLNNLSVRLSEQGHTTEALVAIEQAVEIRRRLAEHSRERFEPELANSLGVLSVCQFEKGEISMALATINEAIDLIQPYAKQFPKSFFGRRYEEMLADRYRYLTTVVNPQKPF